MTKHPANFSPYALVLLILHSLILCVFFFLSAANETSAAAAAVPATTKAGIPSFDQTTTLAKQEEQGNYEEALQIHNEFAKVVLTHSSGGALDMNIEDVMGSLEVQCDDAADEEECMKRRLMSEAHLDYIYTQHHKP